MLKPDRPFVNSQQTQKHARRSYLVGNRPQCDRPIELLVMIPQHRNRTLSDRPFSPQ
ncbi:MAG: hypothetical protein JGK17_08245 [Microcoleus sp. PH2017_10_PVI_O_A]|uniref:hypothetical protein n=1 Tax=unclassified Microcoleus TaxID=2642155 RepID=UPI001DC497D9|nr:MULTISPECIES: hypothetical protein [unclassified Microcoleus]MCC3405569.1 hypothetical protein [Microcoleus sp. PH2017_10_PVI_O_A]MCC3478034.1 hypothetical protein [Microcoleus sp. PH2017_12_PCY_D_A]